jgi:V/A-type H+-transporting ATPase subunit I
VILPMARVQLLGPREVLPAALAFLQEQGVLELRAPALDGRDPPFVVPCAPQPDEPEREARLAEAVRRAQALLARLPTSAAAARPEPLPSTGSAALLDRLAALEGEVAALEERRAALRDEREATARFTDLVVALAPLPRGLDAALQPEFHAVVLRNDPQAVALLGAEVRRLSGGACELAARPLGPDTTGVLVAVPRAHGRALTALLFERGVDEVRLPPAYAGKSLLEVLLLLAARARAIPEEEREVERLLAERAASLAPALATASAEAGAALERLRARGRCGETRFAFIASGYMPAERVEALRAAAAARFGPRVAVLAHPPERARFEEVPVVLRNGPRVRPFELLLALVPLPRYGSVDPTPWLAGFFPLLFGLVLGDVAFGVLGAAVALVARRRGWGGQTGRDLAWIALACSLSAVAFGLVFGEALGELGAHAGLHPLLLDRRRAFLTFLGVALAVGAVHVGVGMALGVVTALRGGHRRHALGRGARLLLLGASAAAAGSLAGVIPGEALRPALLAGLAFLSVATVAEGPLALLDLVLGLGNVLSYARLMALGLASVMLAEVANLVGGTLRPSAAGLALAVLLHAVNFSLGLISPTVAALRLHYVEFFEKFYDEGGVPFRPFALGG